MREGMEEKCFRATQRLEGEMGPGDSDSGLKGKNNSHFLVQGRFVTPQASRVTI